MSERGKWRAEQRKINDQKKAIEQKKKGSILPEGHQRGKGGRTKGSGG